MKRNNVLASTVLLACADVMIGAPEMHCKGVFAKDAQGHSLGPTMTNKMEGAVSFCARGLIYQVVADFTGQMPSIHSSDTKDGDVAQQCHHYANLAVPEHGYIASFNNHPDTTPKMVAKMFEKAAALAIAEGK